MLHHSRQCGIVVEPRSDGMETIRCRMLYDPRLQPKVVKTVAYRWELSVGPGETFSRGLSGENISEFFLAHSGILLIFERRRAPKRCGARGNLPPPILLSTGLFKFSVLFARMYVHVQGVSMETNHRSVTGSSGPTVRTFTSTRPAVCSALTTGL